MAIQLILTPLKLVLGSGVDMAIDPRLSLMLQPLNVQPAINTFLTVREQQRQRAFDPLKMQMMGQQIQQGEQAIQQAQMQTQQAQDLADMRNASNFYEINQGLFAPGQETFLVESIARSNLSEQNKREALEILNTQGSEALGQRFGAVNQIVRRQSGQGLTASQKDFNTFKRLKSEAEQSGDQRKIDAAKQFGRQAGFIRPTEQEKADISVDKSIRTEVGKGNTKRLQAFADNGVEAADSVANLKRSIALLDDVETGGFQGLQIRAKQLFGIEGADEGELSANLGKAVLAQLKPIFGAAFTAAEGERLERIEARLGANTETNKRLLGEALRVAERAAKRGIASAEKLGDDFTANEIRESLATEINLPELNSGPATQIQSTPEGARAVNPQTGQIAIFTNGQWVIQNG